MLSLIASCLIFGGQAEAELPSRVKALVKILSSGGSSPSAAEKELLIGLDRLCVESEITARSLSECLAVLTRPGDSIAAERLTNARTAMGSLFDVFVSQDSSAQQIRTALASYSKGRERLTSLAKRSTDIVSSERIKLQTRPGSGLKKSVSLRLKKIAPKTEGVIVTAHGAPLFPGVLTRFEGQASVSLIASPWDPRTRRRSEFEPTKSIQVLPSSYEGSGRVLEYATQDRSLITRWEMAAENYAWNAVSTPAGSARLTQEDFQPAEGYKVKGHFGILTPLSASSTVTVTIKGRVDWEVSSTRNGRKTTTPESHKVQQSLTIEVFCL